MKQVLQDLKTGTSRIVDVPCPRSLPGRLLIRTSCSLLSAGTERMLVEFGKANIIDKARQHPEKVRMVLNKLRTDGFWPTLSAVRNKLEQPLAMGYSNVGAVLDVGPGVQGFKIGDRVASNGAHAEVVSVPANLCAHIPQAVPDEAGAFTVLGAIAMQGIRLVQPALGETVVVTGLGLIGLMVVQLLQAHGCRVLGIDVKSGNVALARRLGIEAADLSIGEDPLTVSNRISRGRGVDAVIIAASTTTNEPIHQAAQMCRKRGRIVLVGTTGLQLSRDDFYEKELTFQVSCSYGPGRYDPNYEEAGQDYPIGHVRWTAQRNFEAVLDMMAARRLDVEPLISHRFALREAAAAYGVITSNESALGVMLQYPDREERTDDAVTTPTVRLGSGEISQTDPRPSVAFIGAGNYAQSILIPAFKEAGARLYSVTSKYGITGIHSGAKFGFEETTTETDRIFTEPSIDAIVIATRHNDHARLVVRALEAGKHVFVEKPLCLSLNELDEISSAYARASQDAKSPLVMVGFNRRFSPHVQRMKALLAGVEEPKSFVMTVNAGRIADNHWAQDPNVGGGRVLGEACHFIDLLRFLAGSKIVAHSRQDMDSPHSDTVSLHLRFADGSMGTIHYFANGSRAFPKERLEVFAAGAVLQLDNFRKLKGFGWPRFSRMASWRQDKGQYACARAFLGALNAGGSAPIPFDEIAEVSRLSILLAEPS